MTTGNRSSQADIEVSGSLEAEQVVIGHANLQAPALEIARVALQQAGAESPLLAELLGPRTTPARPLAGNIRIGGNVRAENAVVGHGNIQLTEATLDGALKQLPPALTIDIARRLAPSDALLEEAERLGLLSTSHRAFERNVNHRRHDLDPAPWRRRLAELERVVGRVELAGQPIGTCFLVGPAHVLTNYHVVAPILEGLESASAVRVRFDYSRHDAGFELPGVTCGLQKDDWCIDHCRYSQGDLVQGSEPDALPHELDYALLELETQMGLGSANEAPRRWLPLASSIEPQLGDDLLILQHPLGGRLKLSFGRVLELGAENTRIRYDTNTEPGSSGSPCFNQDLELVALHHMGEANSAPDHRPTFNQGIPIAAIIQRLQSLGVNMPNWPGRESSTE